jgi:hypothetical protein
VQVADNLWTPTPLASDSFDRGDSSTLGSTDGLGVEETGGSGLAWTEQRGDWAIATNRLACTPSVGSIDYATVNAGIQDVILQATLNLGATGTQVGLFGRGSSGTNGWGSVLDLSRGDNVISEVNSGTPTERSSSSVALAADTDYAVTVTLDDAEIRTFVNDLNAASYLTAATHLNNRVHGAFVLGAAQNADCRVDDWVCWERRPADCPFDAYPKIENPTPAAPVAQTYTPLDGATDVNESTTLVIDFDVNVRAASGNVVIYNAAGDAVIETIDITSGQVAFSLAKCTITPGSALPFEADVYVLIDSGAIESTDGVAWPGLTLPTDWNFSVRAQSTFDYEDVTGHVATIDPSVDRCYVDGARDYVYANNGMHQLPQIVFGTDDIALEVWVKIRTAAPGGSTNYLVYSGTGTSNNALSFYLTVPDLRPSIIMRDSVSGASVNYTGSNGITLDVWTHLLFRLKRDGNATLYVNGAIDPGFSVDISGQAAALSTESFLYVGAGGFGSAHRIDGLMCYLRFYGGMTNVETVFDATEVTDLYNSGSGKSSGDIKLRATNDPVRQALMHAYNMNEYDLTIIDSWAGSTSNEVNGTNTGTDGLALGNLANGRRPIDGDPVAAILTRGAVEKLMDGAPMENRPTWRDGSTGKYGSHAYLEGYENDQRIVLINEALLSADRGAVFVAYEYQNVLRTTRSLYSEANNAATTPYIDFLGIEADQADRREIKIGINPPFQNAVGDSQQVVNTPYIAQFASDSVAYDFYLDETKQTIGDTDNGRWFAGVSGTLNNSSILARWRSDGISQGHVGSIAIQVCYDAHALTDQEKSDVRNKIAEDIGVTPASPF